MQHALGLVLLVLAPWTATTMTNLELPAGLRTFLHKKLRDALPPTAPATDERIDALLGDLASSTPPETEQRGWVHEQTPHVWESRARLLC